MDVTRPRVVLGETSGVPPTLERPVEPSTQAPTGARLAAAAGVSGLLAAPVRLHIVRLLTRGRYDVHTLADIVGVTVAAVSQHLAKLRLAKLRLAGLGWSAPAAMAAVTSTP